MPCVPLGRGCIEMSRIQTASLVVGAIFFVSFLFVAVSSLREGERRAAGRALLLCLLLPIPYTVAAFLQDHPGSDISLALLLLTVSTVLILILPVRSSKLQGSDTPKQRIDERDVMFSRQLLVEGTRRFEEYYRENPSKKLLDDEFRSRPGLLDRKAALYHPLAFPAAKATFEVVEGLHPLVEGEPSSERQAFDPRSLTEFIKEWARGNGAASVGVTDVRDYHLYERIGRGADYGKPVILDHKWAIALTVEMRLEMISRAPMALTTMESAERYLTSGAMAVQIARFIRTLGYRARAHIDGNYRVVCPLVARDAGLGEIARMGLLMTPRFGPRVRIAVVTTDLPLPPDEPSRDDTVIDFCTFCSKCAEACPGRAIPFGGRERVEGILRWRIDSEACYTHWCKVGTDCARCIAVCPYSHPTTLMHNAVRFGVRTFPLFRRLAVVMDDFLYGRRPQPHPLPRWMEACGIEGTRVESLSDGDIRDPLL